MVVVGIVGTGIGKGTEEIGIDIERGRGTGIGIGRRITVNGVLTGVQNKSTKSLKVSTK